MTRTTIRPVSRKRAAQLRLYGKLRREYLRLHPWCEAPWPCGQPGTEIHHRKGRVGALLLDQEHWSALCARDHRWVTEHPKDSIAMGISELRVEGVAS